MRCICVQFLRVKVIMFNVDETHVEVAEHADEDDEGEVEAEDAEMP